MATITIAGRTLDVADCSIGFWKRMRGLNEKSMDEAVDAGVALFFEVLSHNDGVTKEWLEDHLPMRKEIFAAKLNELLVAGGLMSPKEKPAEGETQAR